MYTVYSMFNVYSRLRYIWPGTESNIIKNKIKKKLTFLEQQYYEICEFFSEVFFRKLMKKKTN